MTLKALRQGYLVGLFCVTGVLPTLANIAFANNSNASDGWQVDGLHGVIHVSGSLTENPCHLAMESSHQSVSLGNIPFAQLKHFEEWGRQVPFHIELLDCLAVETELQNTQTGYRVWSTSQPGVKLRFIAPSAPHYTDVIRVNGTSGLGLRVTNAAGQILPIGKESNPMLLAAGQNRLTYYVSAVRTSGPLAPGAFSALIAFEMVYD